MSDQTIGPTSLAAANATAQLSCGGANAFNAVTVQGTFTGLTLIIESSVDGATWFPMKLTQASTSGTVASDVVSAIGIYVLTSQVPLSIVRARVTAISTGAALVTLTSC